jgi:general secretion pathway protein G
MSRSLHLLILGFSLFLSGCGRIKAEICSLSGTEANESVLKQDLFSLRRSIDNYTMDKAKAPQSLDELVSAGYLRNIPKDPITGQQDWVSVQGDSLVSVDEAKPGISDVRSASRAAACDGSTYASW